MSGSPDFAQLVEAIYEAAVIPEKWPAILDQIATVSGSVGGVLTAAPSTAPSLLPLIVPKIRWISSDAIHDIIVRYFEDGWFARCGWTRRGLKLQYPGFVIDSDLFTEEEIEVEPSYRFFRRHGIGGAATLFMRVPPSETFVFSFDRRLEDGPVTRETARLLDPLRPHLARAALISSRLGLERAYAAAQALSILGLPAAVLCPKHRILAANDLMQALIPVRVEERVRGRLHLADRRADDLLTRALASALTADDRSLTPEQVFSVPVAATDEQPAMVVHVIPIRRRARDIFASAASIVLITPVGGRELPSAGVIQGLFDLTAAETRVAQMIAHGDTIDRIAVQSQISEGTVRSHLKSVFTKTGVSRQAALANLLNSTTIRPEIVVN